MIFEAAFALKIASTPFTNDSFVKTTAFATTLDFQLLNVTIVFQWFALLSFFCWCEVASAAIILYTYLAGSLDLQVLNVTIGFHGLPL